MDTGASTVEHRPPRKERRAIERLMTSFEKIEVRKGKITVNPPLTGASFYIFEEQDIQASTLAECKTCDSVVSDWVTRPHGDEPFIVPKHRSIPSRGIRYHNTSGFYPITTPQRCPAIGGELPTVPDNAIPASVSSIIHKKPSTSTDKPVEAIYAVGEKRVRFDEDNIRATKSPTVESAGPRQSMGRRVKIAVPSKRGGRSTFEVMTITYPTPRSRKGRRDIPSSSEEEQHFGGEENIGFPTERRVEEFRRPLRTDGPKDKSKPPLYERYPKMIGNMAKTPEQRERAKQLIDTFAECFCEELRDTPETDLIRHYIPTAKGAIPKSASKGLYTEEEKQHERETLPKMMEAGIAAFCSSPWSSKTKYVRKKNRSLRMVHNYQPLNDVTLKVAYPMRRFEPIVNTLSQSWIKCFFQADGSNGFWCIPLFRPHAYKTAYPTYMGQACYLRMAQGLTGAPITYSRMKDVFAGPIPPPQPEPMLDEAVKYAVFGHFVDDDFGGAADFDNLFEFLWQHYFPRVLWAKLALNPAKSQFFTDHIDILGFSKDGKGLRPMADKVAAIRDYPTPEGPAELEKFLYLLPFIRTVIPGRADLVKIMKRSMVTAVKEVDFKGKKRKVREVIDFIWDEESQAAFD